MAVLLKVVVICLTLVTQFSPGGNVRIPTNVSHGRICFLLAGNDHTEEDIKAAIDEIEKELHSEVVKLWGKKCVLSVQCSHFYIDTHLVQVAVCDKATGYTGQ